MHSVVGGIVGILRVSWHLLDEAALYVLFGLFVSGLIQIFIKPESIARHLGPQRVKSVVLAALFGVPLPLCSCGVIPTAISLRKQGASKGATLSFLISTPESGIDSIAISFALLDPIMTVFRPLAAFVTGVVAGVVENLFPDYRETVLEREGANGCVFCADDCHEEKNGHDHEKDHNHSAGFKLKKGMEYAFVELLGDIGLWLLGGILVAGVISYFVPESLVANYLGYGWQAMVVMLLVGIPLYICATASTPIAAASGERFESGSGLRVPVGRTGHKRSNNHDGHAFSGEAGHGRLSSFDRGMCARFGDTAQPNLPWVRDRGSGSPRPGRGDCPSLAKGCDGDSTARADREGGHP